MGYADGHPIGLLGGRLALDFVNTAGWSEEGQVVHENIESMRDLRAWADSLDLCALELPSDVDEIRSFRAALRRDFLDLIADTASGRFVPGLRRVDDPDASSFQRAITVAAAGLFIDYREARRIKKCPGDNCGWLFLDETGNGRRRWCSMETCGNRAKARRYHSRVKAAGD